MTRCTSSGTTTGAQNARGDFVGRVSASTSTREPSSAIPSTVRVSDPSSRSPGKRSSNERERKNAAMSERCIRSSPKPSWRSTSGPTSGAYGSSVAARKSSACAPSARRSTPDSSSHMASVLGQPSSSASTAARSWASSSSGFSSRSVTSSRARSISARRSGSVSLACAGPDSRKPSSSPFTRIRAAVSRRASSAASPLVAWPIRPSTAKRRSSRGAPLSRSRSASSREKSPPWRS
jgi:hypothetical protein